MRLFPLFLKLRGRHCLIVGGGKISEGKIESLFSTGAQIRVVSPTATPQIAAWDKSKRLRWQKRKFRNADLAGVFLVIAATSSSQVHRAIYREATRRGVLCNIVDVPRLCDFYYPAVVQRGDLQIAISTAGASPLLAKRLRQKFEREFGSAYSDWLKTLARDRRNILKRELPPAERMRLLEKLASESAFLDYQCATSRKKSTI
jgi:precorrin-2 dehydrogenase